MTKMDELETFLATKKPRSRLQPHAHAIWSLIGYGASIRTIQQYLKQQGVACSISTVHRFIHAKKRAKELEQARAGQHPEVTGGTPVTQESGQPAPAKLELAQENKPTFKTTLPRFDPNVDQEQLKAIFGTKKGDDR